MRRLRTSIGRLPGTWQLALRRARADRTVLAAAGLTVVLATTLLAAGPLYAGAVTEAGLRQRLATEPASRAGIEVVVRARAGDLAALDTLVRARIDQAMGRFLEPTALVAVSDALDGEDLPEGVVTSLAAAPDLLARLRIEAGDLAAAPTTVGAVGVLLHADAAEAIGAEVGTVLDLSARDAARLTAEVVAIGTPIDRTDRLWWGQDLVVEGVVTGTTFTTVGPLLASPEDVAALGDVRATIRWRALPDPTTVTAGSLGAFQRSLRDLDDALAELPDVGAARVDSELTRMAFDAARSLAATRAAVIVVTIQLVVLALYALLLAAGLLVDGRRIETELVRARGGDPGQLGAAAVAEGLLVVVPAVFAAPFLAALALRVLARVGVLAEVGLDLQPSPSIGSFVGAAAVGAVSLAVLATPAIRAAQSYAGTRARRGRQRTRTVVQRSGLDLALLVVALLGLWQLTRAGSPVAGGENVVGSADPLLLAAPALGLLAGAVLVLRLVPLLGRVAERLGTRLPSLVPVLASWQLARRPTRVARSVLLLVLAVAIGVFSTSYARTWARSQADQAAATVGADIAMVPDRRIGAALSPEQVGATLRSLDAVGALTPAVTTSAGLSRNAGSTRVLAVDTAVAAEVLHVRDDLVAASPAEAFAPLASARPAVAGATVDVAAPERLAARLRVDVDALPLADPTVSVTVVASDADGLYHRLGPLVAPTDGGHHQVEVSLAAPGGGAVRGPLVVHEVEVSLPPGDARQQDPASPVAPTVHVEVALAVDGTLIDLSTGNWATPATVLAGAVSPPGLSRAQVRDGTIVLDGTPGVTLLGAGLTRWRIVADGDPAPLGPAPALVTPGFLEAVQRTVGEELTLVIGNAAVPLRLVGTIAHVPGAPEARVGIVLDLATLAAHRYVGTAAVTVPDRWFLALADGADGAVLADRLAEAPVRAAEVVRLEAVADDLRNDAVAVGLIGALTLGFVAAAAFAAVGYLVSAVVAARERLSEFALLRALGTSRRETWQWLLLESGSTVLGSLVAGVGLGLLLAWLVLPQISLAGDGGEAVPVPIVTIPWSTVVVAIVAAAVTLLAVPAVLTRFLDRTRVAEVLRMGEEG